MIWKKISVAFIYIRQQKKQIWLRTLLQPPLPNNPHCQRRQPRLQPPRPPARLNSTTTTIALSKLSHRRPPDKYASSLRSKIPSFATVRAHLVAKSSTWMKTNAKSVTATTSRSLVKPQEFSRISGKRSLWHLYTSGAL